jgi:hypothetical protein
LQHIHNKEFPFPRTGKTKNPKRSKGRTTTPEMQRGLDAYDQIKAAGHQPTIVETFERKSMKSANRPATHLHWTATFCCLSVGQSLLDWRLSWRGLIYP